MTPLDLCEPLFQYVCRVNRSARKNIVYDIEQVRSEIEASGRSLVHLGWDGEVRALFCFDDALRPDAPATIEALRRRGLAIVLLTGDLPAAAQRMASAAGIGTWHAALSPESKREMVVRLRGSHGAANTAPSRWSVTD